MSPGHKDFSPADTNRGPSVPYAGSTNPAAGQWDGRTLSRDRIADYKRFVVTDGEGIRCSVYVSGCPFHCEGCWNSSIWDFQAGHDYTQELEDAIIRDVSQSYVTGLTLLGGEPMLNTPVLLRLCHRLREELGDTKDIWCWTGYTWEELMRAGETPDKAELLGLVDVLVDGRFVKSQKDSLLQFRGSANQRVIDVKASLAAEDHHVVQWAKLHDQHRFVPEMYGKDRAASEGQES
ncbi:MAG: anaerobic ribonucleoside-triphosphate reductase activating protein [Bifidobacteriaceae bacterium]|nr:anaerobic ribonucleoside-triphosphate reductase activating protein [Bifidobacteriaceae bacterium]